MLDESRVSGFKFRKSGFARRELNEREPHIDRWNHLIPHANMDSFSYFGCSRILNIRGFRLYLEQQHSGSFSASERRECGFAAHQFSRTTISPFPQTAYHFGFGLATMQICQQHDNQGLSYPKSRPELSPLRKPIAPVPKSMHT